MFYVCYWHGCRQCFPSDANFVNKNAFAYLYPKNTKHTFNNDLCNRGKAIYRLLEHDFGRLDKLNEISEIDESDMPLNSRHAMFGEGLRYLDLIRQMARYATVTLSVCIP